MLVNEGKKIIMDVGDYGLPLVIKIINASGQIKETDKLTFNIKRGNRLVIEKKCEVIQIDENGKLYFTFSLTKEESLKLAKGSYTYELEAYRDDVYLNTIVKNELFLVE